MPSRTLFLLGMREKTEHKEEKAKVRTKKSELIGEGARAEKKTSDFWRERAELEREKAKLWERVHHDPLIESNHFTKKYFGRICGSGDGVSRAGEEDSRVVRSPKHK